MYRATRQLPRAVHICPQPIFWNMHSPRARQYRFPSKFSEKRGKYCWKKSNSNMGFCWKWAVVTVLRVINQSSPIRNDMHCCSAGSKQKAAWIVWTCGKKYTNVSIPTTLVEGWVALLFYSFIYLHSRLFHASFTRTKSPSAKRLND